MQSRSLNSLEVLIVLAALTGVSQAAVGVTVPLCYQSGVQWVVTGGTVGGITFVETTTNAACVFSINSSVTQTLTTNHTLCSTTPVISSGGLVIQFIVVVQSVSIYNSATDSRFLVRCEFSTATSPVEASFIGVSNSPSGNPNETITTFINPLPQLALYTDVNGTETIVTSSTVLVLGTNVTARITLNQNTTDYDLQIESGEVTASLVGQIFTVGGTVALLNSTTYCALHPVFLSFVYLRTSEGYSYAETQFQVFLPTLTSINLNNTNIQLKFSFSVKRCLRGNGCVQVSCPDRPSSRRRRQIEGGTTSGDNSNVGGNSTGSETYNLTGGFQVLLDSIPESQIDPDEPTVQIGFNPDETVCLDKTMFWGLIMGLIGFFVLALLGSCLLCFYFMRCRRRRERKRVTLETSGSTTLSTLSVDRKMSGEPLPQQNFVLPRFVPYESSS